MSKLCIAFGNCKRCYTVQLLFEAATSWMNCHLQLIIKQLNCHLNQIFLMGHRFGADFTQCSCCFHSILRSLNIVWSRCYMQWLSFEADITLDNPFKPVFVCYDHRLKYYYSVRSLFIRWCLCIGRAFVALVLFLWPSCSFYHNIALLPVVLL